MSTNAPVLTASFWRTRRSAAIAGIVFGVLLLFAMVMMRLALSDDSYVSMRSDGARRRLIRLSLQLIPFAGIAFLWFIGVIRDQLGEVEDRLFSTVFLGSGLLFVAMLFSGAATASGMLLMLEGPTSDGNVWAFGLDTSQGLISIYAMRMAAVFTVSVSTVGRRTDALPRWVTYAGYVVAVALLLGSVEQRWIQLLFPCWVLLVGAVLLLTPPLGRPPRTHAEDRAA